MRKKFILQRDLSNFFFLSFFPAAVKIKKTPSGRGFKVARGENEVGGLGGLGCGVAAPLDAALLLMEMWRRVTSP